jgi:hypothetical protein
VHLLMNKTLLNVQDVRIEHDETADDTDEKHTVSKREAKEFGLIFRTHICGSGCNRNDLQADHLSHHAADGIGGSEKNWIQSQPVRSNDLQVAEECVAEVSDPVRKTPIQPRIALKTGTRLSVDWTV